MLWQVLHVISKRQKSLPEKQSQNGGGALSTAGAAAHSGRGCSPSLLEPFKAVLAMRNALLEVRRKGPYPVPAGLTVPPSWLCFCLHGVFPSWQKPALSISAKHFFKGCYGPGWHKEGFVAQQYAEWWKDGHQTQEDKSNSGGVSGAGRRESRMERRSKPRRGRYWQQWCH